MRDSCCGAGRDLGDDLTSGLVVTAPGRPGSGSGCRLEPALRVDEHDPDHAEGEDGHDRRERDGELHRDGTALRTVTM